MAGEETACCVTRVDPTSGSAGNSPPGTPPPAPRPPPPPYDGPGVQQEPPSTPSYPVPMAPQDLCGTAGAPACDVVAPKADQVHRPGPPALLPSCAHERQQQQLQRIQEPQQPQQSPQQQPQQQKQQQQHWQQLQEQQWRQRGYSPPAIPGSAGNDNQELGRRAANKAGAEVAVVEKENRRRKWAMFVIGNLISVAVVVSEISQLSVCFEEDLSASDSENSPEQQAVAAKVFLFLTLALGLWVDVFSAVTLSAIYASPLDIKAIHKIPAGDMRHCGGTIMIHFLAPFSWALIYLYGGMACVYYGQNAPCGGGYGGSVLETYLVASGLLMFFFGVGMLILSGVMLLLTCAFCRRRGPALKPAPSGPSLACLAKCLTRVRETLYDKVLSKSPIFDLVWQLQGVILSYRAGAFGLATAVLVGGAGVVGEALAAFGSLAPVAVEELLGPIMV